MAGCFFTRLTKRMPDKFKGNAKVSRQLAVCSRLSAVEIRSQEAGVSNC